MSGFGPLGSYPLSGSGEVDLIEFMADGASALDTLLGLYVHSLATSGTASDAMTYSLTKRIVEEANASDALDSLLAAGLHDTAQAHDTALAIGSFVRTLMTEAEATDSLRAALLAILADNANAAPTLLDILSRYEILRDRVLATDNLQTNLTASNLLFATALAADLVNSSFSAYLADNANASQALLSVMEAISALVDEAEASVTATSALTVFGFLDDSAEAEDALSGFAQLLGALSSGAAAAVVLRIGNEEYTAWVLNTENIAVSQYTNYQFNSYAEYDQRYYGAADDGVYELVGDNDAGTAIQAYFRAPLTDYGSASLKRAPQFYIGYTASGDLLLKVIVVSPNGTKEEHWYRMEPRTADGLRETRKQPGKGLKSVYWQYEIHNIDGADFQIETVRQWPMGLTRRVR